MSKQRVVVCAALRSDDGEVVCGVRHYDEIMQREIALMICSEDFFNRSGSNQGFVDNFGKYMDRKEALVVALKADQVIKKHNPKHELCSEDLF